MAKFLNQLEPDFVLPVGFIDQGLGSLEVSSDQPVSILALRLTDNQRADVLLTSTPIADLSAPASTGSSFPQIADGGGYNTTLILLNTSDALEAGTIRFCGDTGAPLTLRTADGGAASSQFTYSSRPGGFARLVSDGTFTNTNIGWAHVIPDMGTATPVGAGLFSLTQEKILVTESGVPAAKPTTHARIYVDKSSGHDTGIAIANPGASALHVEAAAHGEDGTSSVGNGPAASDLAPKGHVAEFAGEFIAGLPDGFTGVLDLSSPDPFSALTLRSLLNERHNFLITTFPIADSNQSPPGPIVFPQIADGGYQTQIILLNTTASASTFTVSFFGSDGSPLGVGQQQSQ